MATYFKSYTIQIIYLNVPFLLWCVEPTRPWMSAN